MLQPCDILCPPTLQEHPQWWKLPENERQLIYGKTQIERHRIVKTLIQKRTECLPLEAVKPSTQSLAGGRLLIFAPDESLSDGMAELASGGFFDADNVPAWDTWLAYVQEHEKPDAYTHYLRAYVLCWIPPALLDLVEAGVSANPEQCIGWLDQANADYGFTNRLKSIGLLG